MLRALTLRLRALLEGRRTGDGRLLTGDLAARLANLGVWCDRPSLPAAKLLSASDVEARLLIDRRLADAQAGGATHAEACDDLICEAAYTWANRLLALRTMEVRGLIDEVIVEKEAYGGRSLVHHRLAERRPEICRAADGGRQAALFEAFDNHAEHLPQLFGDEICRAVAPSPVTLIECLDLVAGRRAVPGGAAIPNAAFESAEVLGWAYQYWHAEEKDRAYSALKSSPSARIDAADMVAATQLYTEQYMVRYLVQNALGGLWLAMHPDSPLAEDWEFFVRRPLPPEAPRSVSDWKVLDPACGSGHFLLEAFDLLYEFYLAEAQIRSPEEICRSILDRNLYGIDIDGRAIQIASASLWMKAAERAFDFRGRPRHLVTATSDAVDEDSAGNLNDDHETLPAQLRQAGLLGALVRPGSPDEKLTGGNSGHPNVGRSSTSTNLLDVLRLRFDVVLTNPPYLGDKRMPAALKQHIHRHHRPARHDLYAAFLERSIELVRSGGRVAMIAQQSWMFLRSFAEVRGNLLAGQSLETLAHLGANAFGEIGGEVVAAAMFVLRRAAPDAEHNFYAARLVASKGPQAKAALLRRAIAGEAPDVVCRVRQMALANVPGEAVLYWLDDSLLRLISADDGLRVGDVCRLTQGLATTNNLRYLRRWWEVPESAGRWFGYAKGGGYARWAGLDGWRLDWRQHGAAIKEDVRRKYPYLKGNTSWVTKDEEIYGAGGWTWTDVASGNFALRKLPEKALFDMASPAIVQATTDADVLAGILNTRLSAYLIRTLSPNPLHLREGYVAKLPLARLPDESTFRVAVQMCVRFKQLELSGEIVESSFRRSSSTEQRDELTQAETEYALAAWRHAVEGWCERQVCEAFALSRTAICQITGEVGTPAGWLPLVEGFESLPGLPAGSDADVPPALETAWQPAERTVPKTDALVERLRSCFENTAEREQSSPQSSREPSTVLPPDSRLEAMARACGVHPVSVLGMLRQGVTVQGWRDRSDHRRRAQNRLSELVLRLAGHHWPTDDPSEVDLAASDGILPLLPGAGPTLFERICRLLDEQLGPDDARRQLEAWEEALAEPVELWLATSFFSHHVQQFQRRPIVWQVASGTFTARRRPAFACLIAYPRLCEQLPMRLEADYLRPLRERYQAEMADLSAESDSPAVAQRERVSRLRRRANPPQLLTELAAEIDRFSLALRQLASEGFACDELAIRLDGEPLDRYTCLDGRGDPPADTAAFVRQEAAYVPDANDGVRANIAPWQRAGLLSSRVLTAKDALRAIEDRAGWRADERRWCRAGKLAHPGWWDAQPVDTISADSGS